MPGGRQLEDGPVSQRERLSKRDLPDLRSLGGSCLQQSRGRRTGQDFLMRGEMIEVRVRNECPFFRALRIHPKIHLREKQSPLLGLDHPVHGGRGNFHDREYT